MREPLLKEVFEDTRIKYIFTDFFDTIVHRTVHPNYVLRLWAKYMIRELGLSLSIDHLYFTRYEATHYLVKQRKVNAGEIPYRHLIREIYRRLKNQLKNNLTGTSDDFLEISEACEFRAESNVQFLNNETVETLRHFKSKGLSVYCVSDFYTSEQLIKRLISHHDLEDIFDGVFISSEHGCSKHEATFYNYLINKLSINAEEVMMIGDNHRSDVSNAKKSGLKAFHIPNADQIKKQKKLRFGNDFKDYKSIIRHLYKRGNSKKVSPYSDYVIFFSLFIEKLYSECRKNNIQNLFFLAREGLFFKKLFDYYQDLNALEGGQFVDTHYLKMSRQSSLQISLKPLEEETFSYLKANYANMSIKNFIENFTFSDKDKHDILHSLDSDTESKIEGFFASKAFDELLSNTKFKAVYKKHQIEQKTAFSNYLKSFEVAFEKEGVYLVDIGWGGTMQDELYKFFDKTIPVKGYYLGLKEFRSSINADTARWGLNFEISPYLNYADQIMMANTELYEQLAQAPHGSTLGYQDDASQYTIEYHEPHEKAVYDKYIAQSQDVMFALFQEYCKRTNTICYEPEMAQSIVTKYALKIGTHIPKRKLKWVQSISEGFYSNIGNNAVGEDSYKMSILQGLKNNLPTIKKYLISPEEMVKYIMRSKLSLYKKNRLLYIPTSPIYYYILLNRRLKKIIGKKVYLKYSHFR
ncbi:HAD family hydrolase [Hyunsoonleella sp. SJ7]|uniref:HAD family hydrolase n=1 Tax=Hyunsoonleella aquatilis TaxID=2762758 RepID=A0A923H898_9FLAO|nr:HAD family hydrolase [Hyunsoonleella aquatilis]MBC3758896.1 HAD family hydrolase [Hyunsoonleella aquatilis]